MLRLMADKSMVKLRRLIVAAAQARELAQAARKRARLAKAQHKLARKAAKAAKKAARHARKLVEEAQANRDQGRPRSRPRPKAAARRGAAMAPPRKRISRPASAAAIARSVIRRLDEAAPTPPAQPGGTPAGP
jgi:hypothetical protein